MRQCTTSVAVQNQRTLWSLIRGDRRARAIARVSTHGLELAIMEGDALRWRQHFGADVDALSAAAEMKRRAWTLLGWSPDTDSIA
jgi:hypothetical protein